MEMNLETQRGSWSDFGDPFANPEGTERCTTKFIYKDPEAGAVESQGLVFAYRPVEDQREYRKIDVVFENKTPIDDINRLVGEEIESGKRLIPHSTFYSPPSD